VNEKKSKRTRRREEKKKMAYSPSETFVGAAQNVNRFEGSERFLTVFCEQGDIPGMVAALKAGADINFVSDDPEQGTFSALHCAVYQNNAEMAKILLEKGIDVTSTFFFFRFIPLSVVSFLMEIFSFFFFAFLLASSRGTLRCVSRNASPLGCVFRVSGLGKTAGRSWKIGFRTTRWLDGVPHSTARGHTGSNQNKTNNNKQKKN
jgi:hypothetical protein